MLPLNRVQRTLLLSIFSLFLCSVSTTLAQEAPRSIIVRLRSEVSLKEAREEIESVVREAGGSMTTRAVVPSGPANRRLMSANRLDRYAVIDLRDVDPITVIGALGRASTIETAFPNHIYRLDATPPNDSAYGRQWALRIVEAEEAWEITRGDSSVLVGVVDTGIEFTHPDLSGALWVNPAEDLNGNRRFDPWPSTRSENGVTGDLDGRDGDGNGFIDDVIGFDFVDQTVPNIGDWSFRDEVPADEQGHGTNVSGIIAATPDNGIGMTGLAPGVKLVAVRAFDATGNGEDDDISAAIIYAADRGVRVLNLSFGDIFYSPLMHDAIRYAAAKGVVIVSSSGNSGGFGAHFPSHYPEVISVGMTRENDLLDPLSTYGSQLSLTAPGVDVVTTALNGRYAELDGTSIATPHVTAVAALLKTIHPNWSADEIRSAMELTAEDRGEKGWDINYGAGRLNARRALESPGPASIAIVSPMTDQGFRGDTVVPILGSAMAPFLDSWDLSYGYGEVPEEWIAIGESNNEGRVLTTLGALDTRGIDGGTIVLRLRLKLTNGRTTERRTRLYIDRSAPKVTRFEMENVWRFAERSLAITLHTDDLTRARVWLRPAGMLEEPYRMIELEAERTGLTHGHHLFLTHNDMARGVPYDLYVELRNTAGDTTLIGSPGSPLRALREPDAFLQETFARLPYTLPYGYTLNQTAELFGDGQKSVALNRFEDGDYGKLLIYSFDGARFVARDSVSAAWLPRGFGDSDGDGRRELLVQARGTSVVFEQAASNGSPLARIKYADTTTQNFWGSGFHDFDRDGRDEVIARSDNNDTVAVHYYVAAWNGSRYEKIATLPNPTQPAPLEQRNVFGPPESVVADFDGDGLPEILFGDNDADFLVYERQADGRFTLVWSDPNDGEGGSEMVTAGDLDGDGRSEIIIGYRTSLGQNRDREYDAPFWTIEVFSRNDDGTARQIWSERVAFVRPTNPFRSALAAGELDGVRGDELVVSVFPNLYVFRWDASAGTLVPLWWSGESVNNEPIIADFDRDGLAELGSGNSRQISFFQSRRDLRRPDPPAGFQGWALNDSTVLLEWLPVPGADYYTIYRGVLQPGQPGVRIDSIGITRDSMLIDTGLRRPSGGLDSATFYVYFVTTRDLDLPSIESDTTGSSAVVAFTHEPARITEVTAQSSRAVRVRMSFYVESSLYRQGSFEVIDRETGEEVEISTVNSADDRSLLITLLEDHPGRTLEVRPTGRFRDYYLTPADTSVAVPVVMPAGIESERRFIATRAGLGAPHTIVIDFNAPLNKEDASRITSYTLDPPGEIVAATVVPGEPDRVHLLLSEDYPLGAFGRSYTVTIMNVRSADGRMINDGAGSVVGFTVSAGDLAGVFAYPQPFSIGRDLSLTFAGLTREAQIEVFTQAGRLVRRLTSAEGNGGASWNGEDDHGERVPSGIYLYRVTGSTADGTRFESELRKIAVVP